MNTPFGAVSYRNKRHHHQPTAVGTPHRGCKQELCGRQERAAAADRHARQLGAMHAAVEQQSALYKDYAVFQQVFPEVQQALKVAMAKLVKARPADPISFLAIALREASEEIKIEKLEEENERKEKEAAAVRIQSLGRARKDKQRVDQIRINNGIFVREL